MFLVAQDCGFPGFDEVTRHSESVGLEIARHGVLRAVGLWMNILGPADVCSARRLILGAALIHPCRSTPSVQYGHQPLYFVACRERPTPGPHERSEEKSDCVSVLGDPHLDKWA